MKTNLKSKMQGTQVEEKPRVNYLVKTKGYKETFDSIEKARTQFDILRKRAIKNHIPVKIQISERTHGQNPVVVDEVNINESYYEVE